MNEHCHSTRKNKLELCIIVSAGEKALQCVVMMDLFTAAGQGDLHTVNTLLQAGADVNQGDDWTGEI